MSPSRDRATSVASSSAAASTLMAAPTCSSVSLLRTPSGAKRHAVLPPQVNHRFVLPEVARRRDGATRRDGGRAGLERWGPAVVVGGTGEGAVPGRGGTAAAVGAARAGALARGLRLAAHVPRELGDDRPQGVLEPVP